VRANQSRSTNYKAFHLVQTPHHNGTSQVIMEIINAPLQLKRSYLAILLPAPVRTHAPQTKRTASRGRPPVVEDMRAFHAEENAIKRDEIAARQPPRVTAALHGQASAFRRGDMFEPMRDRA
jgi:hypothetical protein